MTGEHAAQIPRSPLLVATRSAGKLNELLPMIRARGFDAETLQEALLSPHPDEEHIEAFDTFSGNALAKARWFAERAPGRVVLADDSGLVVDALHGAPGVHSKRYAGRRDLTGAALDHANIVHLRDALARLTLTSPEAMPDTTSGAKSGAMPVRTARFVCAAAVVGPGLEFVAEGEVAGRIVPLNASDDPAGVGRGRQGFGYDPVFLSDELGVTFGHATREQKASVSHRARAFDMLLSWLSEAIADMPNGAG